MTIRNSTRIDLVGATLDIFPLYLFYSKVDLVNISIDIMTEATVDRPFQIDGTGVNSSPKYEYIAKDLDQHYRGNTVVSKYPDLTLHDIVVSHFGSKSVRLETNSQAPVGSGLGASSSLVLSMVQAMNVYTQSGYTTQECLITAQNIETALIKVPTGTQDYLAAQEQGVNHIKYSVQGPQLTTLKLPSKLISDIGDRTHLIYTGKSHFSAAENWKIFQNMINRDRKTRKIFDNIVEIGPRLLKALHSGDLVKLGELISEEWRWRRQLLPSLETTKMQQIQKELQEDLLGFKACGAGAGGCVIIMTEKDGKDKIENLCHNLSMKYLPWKIVQSA